MWLYPRNKSAAKGCEYMNIADDPIIKKTVGEVVSICDPCFVYLVSHKTGSEGDIKSFKLCVVVDDGRDPDRTERELLLKTDPPVPCDFIAYTLEEWNDCAEDDCTFAYRVENGGEQLYVKGR